MNREEFRALVNILMFNDNTLDKYGSHHSDRVLQDFADKESKKRGFVNWIEAFHKIEDE